MANTATTMTVVAIPPATKKIVPATPKVKMSLAEAQTIIITMNNLKEFIRYYKKLESE